VRWELLRERYVSGGSAGSTASARSIVAEGIETVAELAALRELGVRYGQGFYFARPAPLD
jgi:EAL domain-containing protein (putative c-di-GMP-specific phosphodiesterase class I)